MIDYGYVGTRYPLVMEGNYWGIMASVLDTYGSYGGYIQYTYERKWTVKCEVQLYNDDFDVLCCYSVPLGFFSWDSMRLAAVCGIPKKVQLFLIFIWSVQFCG